LLTSVEEAFGSSDRGIVGFNISRNVETHKYDMCSFGLTIADWANLSAYFDNIVSLGF